MELVPNQWYPIAGRDDYEKLVPQIKEFIDCGIQVSFNSDYKKIKMLSAEPSFIGAQRWSKLSVMPAGFTIEKFSRGQEEDIIGTKGRRILVQHSGTSYRVFKENKIIAIES